MTDYREKYRGEKCCATCCHARKSPGVRDLGPLAPYDGSKNGACAKRNITFSMRDGPRMDLPVGHDECWETRHGKE